jgi:hypothetical protein
MVQIIFKKRTEKVLIKIASSEMVKVDSNSF